MLLVALKEEKKEKRKEKKRTKKKKGKREKKQDRKEKNLKKCQKMSTRERYLSPAVINVHIYNISYIFLYREGDKYFSSCSMTD